MAGDTTTIARPYAEAVFAIAREQDALERWSAALGQLGVIISDPAIQAQIGNPNIARERLCDLILAIANNALDTAPTHLVKLLVANDRLAILPEIARLYDQMKTAEQGVRQIQVRTAFDLDNAERDALTATLKHHFGATIELAVETDHSLIGGVEIRADDVVIDGSVRGRLQQLANELQF